MNKQTKLKFGYFKFEEIKTTKTYISFLYSHLLFNFSCLFSFPRFLGFDNLSYFTASSLALGSCPTTTLDI